MAEDWIKMRTDLYRDPKVCAMADLLMGKDSPLARYVDQNCQRAMTVTRNVMRNVTVGALVSVWGVMRLRGKRDDLDLLCRAVTLGVVDDIAEIPGFGEAMEAVGWAEETEEGVIFPRFFQDYNVDPEGVSGNSDTTGAVRQRRYRQRQKEANLLSNNVTDGVTSNGEIVTGDVTEIVTVTSRNVTREEKRREEKQTPSDDLFDEFWALYPRKDSKADARKAFGKLKVSEEFLPTILAGLARAKKTDQWVKDGGTFVPYAATWLNKRRWEDGQEGAAKESWWRSAGFKNEWDAMNAGCTAISAYLWRDGQKAEV